MSYVINNHPKVREQQRLEKELQREKEKEDRERKLYEELKAKYEPQDNDHHFNY